MHAAVRSACCLALAVLPFMVAVAGGQPLLMPPTEPATSADTVPIESSPTQPGNDKRTENAKQLRLAQQKLETSNASDSTAK